MIPNRQRCRSVEHQARMLNRDAAAKVHHANRPGASKHGSFLPAVFLFDDGPRADGRQRSANHAAIAVDLILVVFCGRVRNRGWIERMHRAVRRDHARANGGLLLMPGIPGPCNIVPAVCPIRSQNFVHDVIGVGRVSLCVENVCDFAIENDYASTRRRTHGRCCGINSLGIRGKMRQRPRLTVSGSRNESDGKANCEQPRSEQAGSRGHDWFPGYAKPTEI